MTPFLKMVYFSLIFLLSKHKGQEILYAFVEMRSVSFGDRKSICILQFRQSKTGKTGINRDIGIDLGRIRAPA